MSRDFRNDTEAEPNMRTSSPVSDLVERLRGTHTCDGCDEYVGSIIHDLCDEAASTLTTLSTHNAELEREVKRLREAQQWHPIDTAPKDGTDIVARDCITGTSHVTFWNGFWHDPDSHYYSEAPDFVPSVWFPLPETSALSTSPQGGEHE